MSSSSKHKHSRLHSFKRFTVGLVVFTVISLCLSKGWNLYIFTIFVLAECWAAWFCFAKKPLPEFLTAALDRWANKRTERRLILQAVELQPFLSWIVIVVVGIVGFVLRDGPIILQKYSFKVHERWEIGALSWNVVSAIVFYCWMPEFTKEYARKIWPVLVLSGGIVFSVAAAYELASGQLKWHFLWVFCSALFYLAASYISAKDAPDAQIRYRFLKMFLYADAPTVVSLGFLGIAVLNFRFGSFEQKKVFLSGIVAFQFIACSLVTALIDANIDEAFHIRVRRMKPLSSSQDQKGQSAPTVLADTAAVGQSTP